MSAKTVEVHKIQDAYEQFKRVASQELRTLDAGKTVDAAERAFDLIAIDRAGDALTTYLHLVEDAGKEQVTPAFDPRFDNVVREVRAAGLKDTADLLSQVTSYRARNARMKAAQLAAKH